ncbi:MAG: hypothetical protein ACYC27_02805 [Armatimonadota bacterium]
MNKWDIWKKRLWFISMVGGIIFLAFDVIPDLIKHNSHRLPDVFLGIFVIFISFIKWFERNDNDRFIKILRFITIIPFVAYIVTGIIMEGMSIKYSIMLFYVAIFVIFAILLIPAKIWERRSKDHQESSQDASGKN